MISFWGTIILAGVLLYMGMIYESTSLALLSCAAAVFAVLSLCVTFFTSLGRKFVLEIPISMAQQGGKIKLYLREADMRTYGRIKVKLILTNTTLHKKYKTKQVLGAGKKACVTLTAEEAGRYEVQLVWVKIYDASGLVSVKKRGKQAVSFIVLPTIYPANIRLTEAARNFVGDAEVYDTLRSGHDPAETFKLRAFRDGDKLQNIHWKLSAKEGELIVREKSLPRACVAVLLLEPFEETKKLTDAYLRTVASLSFSMMDMGCPHFVAWSSVRWQDVVRMRVDDEESFYECFLYLLEELGEEQTLKVQERYREKYSAEVILYQYLLKGNLELILGDGPVAKFSPENVEKSLADTELLV